MKMDRLDKYLANRGLGTRREVKEAIKGGRVIINDAICKDPQTKISEEDRVSFDGKEVDSNAFEYYMLHKAAGCVTATKDNLHPTVMDHISSPRKKDLFPVGRLDIDTEGLLLITNDGALAHRLLSPAHHVTKEYVAIVQGQVTEREIHMFAEGLDIGDDTITLPAQMDMGEHVNKYLTDICFPDDLAYLHDLEGSERMKNTEAQDDHEFISCVTVCIQEGRFHQIKRMFRSVGMKVLYLKRISMGSLTLDENLPKGEYRSLTLKEIKRLQED